MEEPTVRGWPGIILRDETMQGGVTTAYQGKDEAVPLHPECPLATAFAVSDQQLVFYLDLGR